MPSAAGDNEVSVSHSCAASVLNDDPDSVEVYGEDARSRARMQAFLPAAAGGLGLGCAQLTAAPAYVRYMILF